MKSILQIYTALSIEPSSIDNAEALGYARNSQERMTNAHGKALLELVNVTHLNILNFKTGGKTVDDLHGKYTFHNNNGSSVNDYAITDYDSQDLVKHFKVVDPVYF